MHLVTVCMTRPTLTASSHIHFQGVRLDCNCVDFDVLKILFSSHSDTLNRVFCRGRDGVIERVALTVPLHQLVCELKQRCPPGCRCVHRPANATLHVYCSNANITVLPPELPELPKSYTKYKLDLSNNRLLRRLERRAYFVNTSILDVSNCKLESINSEVWNDLANMTRVFLDRNQLQSLPSSVAEVSPVTRTYQEMR